MLVRKGNLRPYPLKSQAEFVFKYSGKSPQVLECSFHKYFFNAGNLGTFGLLAYDIIGRTNLLKVLDAASRWRD